MRPWVCWSSMRRRSTQRYVLYLAHQADLTDPVADTILLVTDHFGSSLNPAHKLEAKDTQELALKLAEAGYRVSVLYTGDETRMYQKVARQMSAKGITLSRQVFLSLVYTQT